MALYAYTKENKNRPWILFESGALAKGLTSGRVCTFLVDLVPADLENPLAQFNHTYPTKESMWELVLTINRTLKDSSLQEAILNKVFETYWPQFEECFHSIVRNTPEVPIDNKRDKDDILLEVLSTVRGLERRIRDIDGIPDHRENDMATRLPPGFGFAERRIEELLDTGYPPSVIVSALHKQGVPKFFTMKKIEEYNMRKDESSNDV